MDFHGLKATEYSIDPLTCTPIIKQYIDGGSLRQYLFAFTSTEHYSQSDVDNIENSGFYENFSDWLEEQNRIGNLPILEGRNIQEQAVYALTPGYLFDADDNTARYQIQCQLQYTKEV